MEFKAEVTSIKENDLSVLFGEGADSNLAFVELKNETADDILFNEETDNVELEKGLVVEVKKTKKENPVQVEQVSLKTEDVNDEEIETLFENTKETTDGKDSSLVEFKEIVDYLITEGVWADFEGKDEIDIDKDTFQKIAVEQSTALANQMFEELLDQSGDYGKAIFEHIKNQGNPDDIIDLFKLEKETKSLDITSTEGQEELIYKYYSEDEIGWSREKIKRFIDNLKIEDELETEAKEVKDKYDRIFQKRLSSLNEEREANKRIQLERVEAYKSNVITTLKSREDLSNKEKALIADYMLNYDQKTSDGQTVNKFYVKFLDIQNNLNDFVDLVNFVMDKDKYLKKINSRAETTATKKTFEFIKKGKALENKNSGTSLERNRKEEVNLFSVFN